MNDLEKLEGFNENHGKGPGDAYWSGNLHQYINGLPVEFDPLTLSRLLREVAAFIDRATDLKDKGLAVDPHSLADCYCFLHEAHRLLPEFDCWRVMKVYRDQSWRPAVWVGCLNEAQAQEIAPLLRRHYNEPRDHGDQYVVEFGPARVIDIIDPRLTAEAYMSRLR
jgi:hypothetical protein